MATRKPHKERIRKQRERERAAQAQHQSEERTSLNDVNKTVEQSKSVQNNGLRQKQLHYQKNSEIIKKKDQLLSMFDFNNEKDSSLNAERHLLGGLLYLDRSDYQDFLTVYGNLISADFYDALNAVIYDAIINDYKQQYDNTGNDENININIAHVNSLILNTPQKEVADLYENANGVAFLVELQGLEANTTNIRNNASLVKRFSNRRQLLNQLTTLATEMDVNNPAKTQENFANFTRLYNKLLDDENNDNTLTPATITANEWLAHVQKLYSGDVEQEGLSLGTFNNLNQVLTGLRPGQMVTIGARPAMGKTAFAVNLIRQELQNDSTFQEEKRKPTIAMFSLEMNRSEILERFAASLTGIKGQNIRTGNVNEEELRNLMLFVNDDTQGLYINDNPNITTAEIESQLLKLKEQQGHLDLVVIDYLQLINSNLRTDNRQQEVSQISRDIKKIAKSLEVPIISLVQLSRSLEARQDKRPTLSDIRESGSIEQDSDIVMFLYRDDYYERDDTSNDDDGEDGNVSEIEVIVAKNRQGERATVKMLFLKDISRFQEVKYVDNN